MLIHKLYSKNYKNIKLVSLSLLIITGCNNFSEIPSVPTDGNIENSSYIPTPVPTTVPTASPTPKSTENSSYIPTPVPTTVPTASPTPKSGENLINILKPPKKGEILSDIPIPLQIPHPIDRRNTKNPSYISTPEPTASPTPKSRENLINILKPPKKGEILSNIPIPPQIPHPIDRRNRKNRFYIPTPVPTASPIPDNLPNSPTPRPTKTTFPSTAQ